MTKPVCSHVLAFKAQIDSCHETRLQISAYKANSSLTELPSQTIPGCIRYIIGVFLL